MTSPHDIGIQILCWLFNGEEGSTRFYLKNTFALWVGLSADDLVDAYHGVPNIPEQMNLCVVAMRNPHTGTTEFYISKSHLFGLSAAVVHFNRLPELMTAICRRIGHAPSWHFFDDQGTLDFETAGPRTQAYQGCRHQNGWISSTPWWAGLSKRRNTCHRKRHSFTWDSRTNSKMSSRTKYLWNQNQANYRTSSKL